MDKTDFTLYLEINDLNFIFFVGEKNEQNFFKLSHKTIVPLEGIKDNRVTDTEKATKYYKKKFISN